jgi:hypothetical protein
MANLSGDVLQPNPLLATKLYIPPVRPDLASRPRLIEQLNAGLNRRLTLISARAGFGTPVPLNVTMVSSEEGYCLEKYGDAYRDSTPRWIGIG